MTCVVFGFYYNTPTVRSFSRRLHLKLLQFHTLVSRLIFKMSHSADIIHMYEVRSPHGVLEELWQDVIQRQRDEGEASSNVSVDPHSGRVPVLVLAQTPGTTTGALLFTGGRLANERYEHLDVVKVEEGHQIRLKKVNKDDCSYLIDSSSVRWGEFIR